MSSYCGQLFLRVQILMNLTWSIQAIINKEPSTKISSRNDGCGGGVGGGVNGDRGGGGRGRS
jgi:hypothetical protein